MDTICTTDQTIGLWQPSKFWWEIMVHPSMDTTCTLLADRLPPCNRAVAYVLVTITILSCNEGTCYTPLICWVALLQRCTLWEGYPHQSPPHENRSCIRIVTAPSLMASEKFIRFRPLPRLDSWCGADYIVANWYDHHWKQLWSPVLYYTCMATSVKTYGPSTYKLRMKTTQCTCP